MTRAPATKRAGVIAALSAALMFAALAGSPAQTCNGFD